MIIYTVKVGDTLTLGERIRDYRKRLGLTQEELATKLHTTPQNIYKYEKGVIENIPLNSISALAEIFGINPGILMGWTEDFLEPLETSYTPSFEFEEFDLTSIEKELIRNYRNNPDLHEAIHKLLNIDTSSHNDNNVEVYQYPTFSNDSLIGHYKVATPMTPYNATPKKAKEKE